MKLVLLKENSDEEETGRKIRSVLVPIEYTRVDLLVDVVFATARDIDPEMAEVTEKADIDEAGLIEIGPRTDRGRVQKKRDEISRALSRHFKMPLIKRSRAMLWSADHSLRFACTISKRYDAGHDYWYAFHPSWREFLKDGESGYFVLGCIDISRAFVIPLDVIDSLLENLNITKTGRGMYWHIHLNTGGDGNVSLVVPRRRAINLESFAIQI